MLHDVCGASGSESPFLAQNIPMPEGGRTSLIDALLAADPRAPLLPDQRCELPLHAALRSLKSWELLRHVCTLAAVRIADADGSLPLHMAIRGYDFNNEVIAELWKLYPEATSVVDGATGMLAFQLAAIGASESSDTISHLSQVYFYLRSDPQVLDRYVACD